LLRPTTPKETKPSMEITHCTASRGVSIEPRRHWHALYQSTRSRGPRDKAGSSNDRTVPDSARASVGRYELLRTTEGQGCHQGLLQSLSGSIGTGCDMIPSSVLPGTITPLHCQASNSVAIVRELRSTPWSCAHHSVCDQGNRTGIGGIHTQAMWSLWHSTDYAWEQCSISLWRATRVPSSLIVTYRLLATFFSASLNSYCLHIRSRSPRQHESTPL